MTSPVEYQKQGSVGVITLNNPPVNALSVNKGVVQGILDALKEGDHDPHVRAFVLIGAGRNFSGGADISEFGGGYDPGKAKLPDVLGYMDTVTKPIVAAIHGPTMGGGLDAGNDRQRRGIAAPVLGHAAARLLEEFCNRTIQRHG